jgi:hypothetical protein
MRSRLFSAIVAAIGIVSSGGSPAAPPLPCGNYATVAAWAVAGSCVDNQDGDLLVTYVATTGLFPASAAFSVSEVELAGVDLYNVSFDFGATGWTGGGTVQYRLTPLNQERIAGASFDTIVQGTGALATKQLFDIGIVAPFLTLTSTNGSRDPPVGNASFSNRADLLVTDTFNATATAVYIHADNFASVVQTASTAVPVDSAGALAMLAFLLAMVGAYRLRVQAR